MSKGFWVFQILSLCCLAACASFGTMASQPGSLKSSKNLAAGTDSSSQAQSGPNGEVPSGAPQQSEIPAGKQSKGPLPKGRLVVRCVNSGETRKLASKGTPEGGCELLYTKGGQTRSIARGERDTVYCDQVFKRVKANLEKSGFHCE